MQSDNIIEKARQLGLDTGNSSSSADNLRTIASQVGLNNFNTLYDLGKLEGILDQKLSDAARNKRLGIGEDQEEAGGGETTPIRNNKFGQAAYDRAKGKNGVYDPEYYKKKQQKLDEKADKLNQERKNKTKLNKGETKPKADGSNTTKKSKMDRVMDNLKFAKAKKDAITNKIDGAKASAYNALHPVEHAKNIAKAKAKEKAKAVSKKAKAKAKAVAASVGKKILAFISANPWILLVIGGLILLIFLILSIIALGGEEEDGYYNKACDFNSAPVHLTICNTEDEQVIDLKKYVLGSTASLIGDLEFSDDALKAIMIIMKTNALSLGNYNNAIKDVYLDTCTFGYSSVYPENYEDLYADIENYLYLSSIYNDEITNLSLSNYLVMDEATLISIKANENNSYESILSLLYDNLGGDVQQTYSDTLFLGDSQLYRMMQFGIVNKKKVVYSNGYGYDWLVGNSEFSLDNTNSANGGIAGINEKIEDNTNYNIVIWLGLNDVGLNNAQEYFDTYYELATGSWSNHSISVFSLGPVDTFADYSNVDINNFNETMEGLINGAGLSNLKFVRINYDVKEFREEIYYGNADYKKIYKQMLSSLDTSSTINNNYKIYSLADHCEYIYLEKSGSNACEAMSISSTSLSRDEFITRLQSYYASHTSNSGNIFSENAGTIYDLAVANNINPEVVVVRAILEGYSPASMGYSNYNNYWGIACYNGQKLSNCASYSSFSEGVLGFINVIKSYDSLSSMLKKYAYIGKYWFNPGDAGTGGCHYYEYINKYMSYARSEEVGKACAADKACSGSGCVATIDEDQKAYSMYQVEKMASQRNAMFNLSDDLCENYSQTCTYYAQGDARWSSKHLGNSSATMGMSGCAVTALAMGISCSGVETTIADFDAGKFLDALNAGSCFDEKGYFNWDCGAISKIAPGVVKIADERRIGTSSNSYKMGIINKHNINNNIVLVHFVNDDHENGHYIAVTSTNGDTIIGKDPTGGKVSQINVSVVDQVVAYKTSDN